MKPRHILFGLVAGLPLLMSARPAAPGLRTVVNADGSTVELRCFGDEHFDYYTDASVSTVMELDASGNWKPAMRDGRVLRPVRSDLLLLQGELTPNPAAQMKTRMAPIDKYTGRTSFPTLQKDVHSLVVLIEFSDTKFTVPDVRQAIDDMLNKPGYDAYLSNGSARDYYEASSAGQFTPIFDVVGPVTVSDLSSYYVGRNGKNEAGQTLWGAGRCGRFGEAIQEALGQLDEEIDFSKYDYDGDDDIDTVFFFYAGYGQADSGKTTTVWPHQADFSSYCFDGYGSLGLEQLYLDGKRVGPYACSNELNFKVPAGHSQPWLDGIGAFCHEFGHVLGLPDLYDTVDQYSTADTPGAWSIMDTGSYSGNSTCPPLFSAYERWACRWLEFDDPVVNKADGTIVLGDDGFVTVPSLAKENKAVRLGLVKYRPGYPVYEDEFYVCETRQKSGWDAELPDEGMLIWHFAFDYSLWRANSVNSKNFMGVSIVRSDDASKKTAFNSSCKVTWADNLPSTKYADVINRHGLTNIQYYPGLDRATFHYIASKKGDPSGIEETPGNGPVIAGGNGCVIAPAEASVFNLQGAAVGRENLPAGVYVVALGGKTVKVVVR